MHHHNREFVATLDADRRARHPQLRPPADSPELARLLRGAADRDATAWSALVERFTARLLRTSRAFRLSAHDAEDVMQTTWLRLLEHADDVREPAAIGRWLETTARRESLRTIRAARREHPTDDEHLRLDPVAPVDECQFVAAEQRAALGTGLIALPERQRQLLAMLFAEDEPSYRHISHALDMPVGSIGPTRERGLARLRRDPKLIAAIGDRDN